MKRVRYLIFTAILVLSWAMPVMAQYGPDTTVQGHIRKDGTYVPPHHRTAPDNDRSNNYSTQGNINPYTGQKGTVNPFSQPTPSGQQRQKHSWP